MQRNKIATRNAKPVSLAYFVWDASVGDFEKTYRGLAAAGIGSVTLDARRGNLDIELKKDAARAGRILGRLGLAARACHGLFEGVCHFTDEDVQARAVMLRRHLNLMENAAALGATTYVIHAGAGRWRGAAQRRAAFDRLRGALDLLAPAAGALGLALALENGCSPDYLFRSSGELLAFVEEYGTPALGICYDSGHAHMTEGETRALKILAPQVVTMHLHDNHGREDEHLVPGEGTIDWSKLVPLIRRCPRLRHLETEAANSRQWPYTGKVRPVAEVYRRYLEILNCAGSGLACR